VLRVPNSALRFRPPPEMLASLSKGSGGRGGSDDASAQTGEARGGGGGGRSGAGRRGGGMPTPDRKTVWVLREGKPVPVTFKAGVSDGSLTEIAEGELIPGDQVITGVSGGSTRSNPAQGGGGGAFRRVF
jgi:HlyD family secretion protein